MNTKRLIQIGGVINLLFVIFHLAFWELFDWPHSLNCLSSDNRAIMQVFNIQTAFVLAFFSVLSLALPNELHTTKLGWLVRYAVSGFWVLRAVNQLIFWDLSFAGSWMIITICTISGALYLMPLTNKNAVEI